MLGIRVTRSSYTLAIIDIFGELKNLEKHSITKDLEDPSVFERILEDASTFLLKNDQKPVGVGMALPGPYLINEDTSLFLTNQGWKSFTFTKKFESRLHLPVFVEQDSNVGAMGEWWFGNSEIGQGTKVFVSTGDGVGAGIVVDGKIQRGALGAAGEIGHMSINFEGPQCQCGNKGCLEQYASATGIVNMAKENVPEGSYLADKKVTAKAVFDGAKEGDAYCMKVVEKFGRYLGVALSNVAHVVDPEAFVIGGGVSAAGQILLDVVEKYYNENSMFALKNKSFHLAELGNDAGIYGAVRMVLFK